MLPGGQAFTHWPWRQIGDAELNSAGETLLHRLLAQGELQHPRGLLYRYAVKPGSRQSLFLDLSAPLPLVGQSGVYRGIWLEEQCDGKIYCYGAERATGRHAIGGRMLQSLPVLEPDARWIDSLAERLAAQTLPEAAGARVAPGRPSDRWLLAQVEQTLLRAALAAFCAALDPALLAVVRAEGHATPAIFNSYCSTHPTEQRHRIQAAQTHPWFADALREDWQLRRAVTQGVPLTRALATRFQVQPRTIQHVRALTLSVSPTARMALVRRLDALPAEYLPKSDADWADFLAFGERLSDLAGALGVECLRLLRPFRQGWRAGATTLADQAGAPLDVDSIFEMMQAAYHYGVRPTLLAWQAAGGLTGCEIPGRAPTSLFPLWFGRLGLARLMVLAQRWRESIVRFGLARLAKAADADAGVHEPLTWPALLETGHTHDGYRVQELTSQRELELEGHRLQHCVGGYAAACLNEPSFIYSVRDRVGHSLSTFEVRMSDAGFVLVQHKALANRQPDAPVCELVSRYLKQVLARVPSARVAAVCAERRAISVRAAELIDQLELLEADGGLAGQPDAETTEQLVQLTAFLHPANVKRYGIQVFLRLNGEAVLQELARGKCV
jgi:hypothetical protein